MSLTKLFFLASMTIVSLDARSEDAKPIIEKNADGTTSVSYSLPPGSKEGVYLAGDSAVMVIKPSAALAELGVEVGDRILSACDKDLTTKKISEKEKLEIVKFKQTSDCAIKIDRKNSVIYLSLRKK